MPPRKRVTKKKEEDDKEQHEKIVSPNVRRRRPSFGETISKDFDEVIHSIEHLGEDILEAVVGTGGEDMYDKMYVCPTEKYLFICTGFLCYF